MFLTHIPLRLFFFFSTLFFPPSICRYSGVLQKNKIKKTMYQKETRNIVPRLWPYRHLKSRNFSKCWTLLLCPIFTLELLFRSSSCPATSPTTRLQLVPLRVPVRGPASSPGTSFSRSPTARPGASFAARPGLSRYSATPGESRYSATPGLSRYSATPSLSRHPTV